MVTGGIKYSHKSMVTIGIKCVNFWHVTVDVKVRSLLYDLFWYKTYNYILKLRNVFFKT